MTPWRPVAGRGPPLLLPLAPQGDSGAYNALPGAGVEYRLVYTLTFRREGVLGTWEAKIDAHTGEILSFSDTNAYGNVSGGIYPVSRRCRSGPPLPLAHRDQWHHQVHRRRRQLHLRDGHGLRRPSRASTSRSWTPAGPPPSRPPPPPATWPSALPPGPTARPPASAARATRTRRAPGTTHLTNWKLKAMAWLPSNTWLQGQLTDNVNLNQTCNAYWNGSSVNMFKSGGGCRNSGELPTVVLHEVGHGLDTNDGNSSSDTGTGESYGDTKGSCDPRLLHGRGSSAMGPSAPATATPARPARASATWTTPSTPFHQPHTPSQLSERGSTAQGGATRAPAARRATAKATSRPKRPGIWQ